mgnify:FL=1
MQEQSFRCFVCNTNNNIEMHHVKKSSSCKKNHKQLIPLCMDHHRYNKVSPHGGSKRFLKLYPMPIQIEKADLIYNLYQS